MCIRDSRSLHLMQNGEYKTLPARLRMNILANPGAPKAEYELWCTAVSAINGCGACIDSHEKTLREHGVTNVQVQASLRIASVVNAVSRVLAAEALRRRCGRMEWVVLDWNQLAIDFYEKLGARQMREWYTYRLTAEQLAEIGAPERLGHA